MSAVILFDLSYVMAAQKLVWEARNPGKRHFGLDFEMIGPSMIRLLGESDVAHFHIFWAIPSDSHPLAERAHKSRDWFRHHPVFICDGMRVPMSIKCGHLVRRYKKRRITERMLDSAFPNGEIGAATRSRLLNVEFEDWDDIQKGVDAEIILAIMDACNNPDVNHIILVSADGDFVPAIDRAIDVGKKITMAAAHDTTLGLGIASDFLFRQKDYPEKFKILECTPALLEMNKPYIARDERPERFSRRA